MTLLADIQAKVSPAILAGKDPQAIADAFNAGRTRLGKVAREDFTIWAASSGMRAILVDVSVDPVSPLRNSALACLDVIGGAAGAIDFSIAKNLQMLGAWLAYGMVAQIDYDALIALATKPDPIDELTIRRAILADNGDWLV